eukprot:3335758-Lingulodinium_polyedra.AAC.1
MRGERAFGPQQTGARFCAPLHRVHVSHWQAPVARPESSREGETILAATTAKPPKRIRPLER